MKDELRDKTHVHSRKYDAAALPAALRGPAFGSNAHAMRQLNVFAAAMLAAVAPGGGAQASSSDWFEMEGARIRLVTAGRPDADGQLKGFLDIQLKPGWKTYWRDPGDAGVPPSIDVSADPGVAKAEFAFPAPQRHDDGDFQWAGYDYPLALPVTFTVKQGAAPTRIDADVFLGICEAICVPVQTRLELTPGVDSAADKAAVAAAFAAIPMPATAEFGVKLTEATADRILLEASHPGDPQRTELFLASEDGYVFRTPVREMRDGKTFFAVEVTRPDKAPAGEGIPYTLVTAGGAVNGVLPYF